MRASSFSRRVERSFRLLHVEPLEPRIVPGCLTSLAYDTGDFGLSVSAADFRNIKRGQVRFFRVPFPSVVGLGAAAPIADLKRLPSVVARFPRHRARRGPPSAGWPR